MGAGLLPAELLGPLLLGPLPLSVLPLSALPLSALLEAQLWIPHSVLAVPAQRPLRGSPPSATLTVQVRQPIDG